MEDLAKQFKEHENLLPALSDEAIEKCLIHYELLKKHNPSVYLVSKQALEAPFAYHYADAFWMAACLFTKFPNKPIHDIGSGAGFPGIILALFNSNAKITLYERDKGKLSFLEEAVSKLQMENVNVRGTAPIPMPEGLVISRGVFNQEKILKTMRKRLSLKNTLVVCRRGNQDALKDLEYKFLGVDAYNLPMEAGSRQLEYFVPRGT